jgi:protoheme ferro-lyase
MYPNVRGRHSNQPQIKQNVIGLSTFTGVRKIIYICVSFVRPHLAVLHVISKEQKGFTFVIVTVEQFVKNDTNSVAQKLLKE